MKNRYLDYLYKIVRKNIPYVRLIQKLFSMEFYSFVPNDDNRVADGLYLRSEFCEKEELHALSFCPDGPCTVLEMLIGLSLRLEFETSQSKYEKTPREWFWILIDNLGLSEFNDEVYTSEIDQHVENVIQICIDRKYSYLGEGGLFPLKRARSDQRTTEIWYQMSAYLLENYPI